MTATLSRADALKDRLRAPLCGRCGAPGPFGYSSPYGAADRGQIHACAEHRAEAEARWREIYGLGMTA